jgi:hypothetical protein|tara:strand:+ start:1571 stop:1687 length:117 start_codon:yes stop_codon:yes gene_type:complete
MSSLFLDPIPWNGRGIGSSIASILSSLDPSEKVGKRGG